MTEIEAYVFIPGKNAKPGAFTHAQLWELCCAGNVKATSVCGSWTQRRDGTVHVEITVKDDVRLAKPLRLISRK